MAFYELVFIARQDISSADVEKITAEFSKIVTDCGSVVVKTEYWGLRTLAYQINKNSKGHYVLLGIDADFTTLKEVERKMKLHGDIIRFLSIKVDAISADQSAILKVNEEVALDLETKTAEKVNIESAAT